ncbi:MAG: polysaccharide biosynthesis protein [Chitinophagaceae bacterium]|nr:MAG: polysaccharide biosynthesis protein [Chitinophagaceae bacterium]
MNLSIDHITPTETAPADATIAPKQKLKGKVNLKQRAYLNSLSGMIDYAGVQITGFFINPFIVSGLGSSMYGIWQMINQMTGYTKMVDTRATQVLKWSLAAKRDVAAEEEMRNDVTTALVVTALTMPFALIIGAVLSWYAPHIVQAQAEYVNLIRITCSILIFGLIINKFFDLFEAVLGGMNLGYKRMGFRAMVIAVGGVIKILVIINGFGIIGLSIVQVALSLFTGFIFYRIVKKHVPWFRFGKTNTGRVKAFGKLSGWYMAFTTLKMLLMNSDKIILGYIIGPLYVAKYSLTMFTSMAVQGAVVNMITGVTPGISSMYGNQEFEKVNRARKTIMLFAWLVSAAIGCTILMVNKSFVSLWVGSEHYAGNFENLLILLISVQVIFFQIDSFIINVTLNMKSKVQLSACVAVLSIVLGFLLIQKYQIAGLCFSVLIGRLFYTIGFPVLFKKQMKDRFQPFSRDSVQPLIVTLIMFALTCYAGYFVDISSWLLLIVSAAAIFSVAGFTCWYLAIRKADRASIITLLSGIKMFRLK